MIYEFKEIDIIKRGDEFNSDLYPHNGFWIANDSIYMVNKDGSGYVHLLAPSAVLLEVEEYVESECVSKKNGISNAVTLHYKEKNK